MVAAVACWDEAGGRGGGGEAGAKLQGNYIFIHLGRTAQSALSTVRESYVLTDSLPYDFILLFCTYIHFVYLFEEDAYSR